MIARRNERLNAENVSDAGAVAPADPTQRSNELYQEAAMRNLKLERMQKQPAHEECTF